MSCKGAANMIWELQPSCNCIYAMEFQSSELQTRCKQVLHLVCSYSSKMQTSCNQNYWAATKLQSKKWLQLSRSSELIKGRKAATKLQTKFASLRLSCDWAAKPKKGANKLRSKAAIKMVAASLPQACCKLAANKIPKSVLLGNQSLHNLSVGTDHFPLC